MLGTLNNSQTHSAKTKDRNRGICFNLARVPDSTKPSRYTTSKQTHLFKWSTGIDLGTRNLGKNSILAHGRATHKVEDILSVLVMEANGSIWHHSLSLRGSNLGAKISLRALTENARRLATLRSVARDHMITDSNRCDAFSNRLNNTPSFVTKDAWEQSFRIKTIQSVDIRVAQSVRDNFDSDFASLWWIYGNLLFDHRLLGATSDHGLAFDRFSFGRHDEEQTLMFLITMDSFCDGCSHRFTSGWLDDIFY
mmetsp:Transcript_2327/g.6659  ORF Transcript_2327/g.6659 Transcript_2327/m.6659 type:complete len:252 (-) Transcript_2327:48-803(-)